MSETAGAKTVRAMPFAQVPFRPRGQGGDMALLAPLTGPDDGTPLGTGFARLSAARLDWTLAYDEVILVIEWRLTVHANGVAHTLGPQDTIWLPKGTALTYEADAALIFYSVHPADAITT